MNEPALSPVAIPLGEVDPGPAHGEWEAVQRIVTGHDSSGKAVFVAEERVEAFKQALTPGATSVRVWQGSSAPAFPDDGSPTTDRLPFFPAVGGFGFYIFNTPPKWPAGGLTGPESRADLDDYEENRPGSLGHFDRANPGMHRSDTIDLGVVLAGEVVLELDDGAERTLRAGDVFVQNGTTHRWTNRTSTTASMAVFLTGAHRRPMTDGGGSR